MSEERIEHLKLVQAVIARMAQNAFLLKGWSVTVATAMMAVAVNERRGHYAILALLPALAFWGLDAFYLRQERLFRALHDDICAAFGSSTPVSFSMKTKSVSIWSWVATLFDRTVLGLHGPIVVVILAVVIAAFRR